MMYLSTLRLTSLWPMVTAFSLWQCLPSVYSLDETPSEFRHFSFYEALVVSVDYLFYNDDMPSALSAKEKKTLEEVAEILGRVYAKNNRPRQKENARHRVSPWDLAFFRCRLLTVRR